MCACDVQKFEHRVIDEAQLIGELPLALKSVVDELGAGNHFILTGSASIGRSGLGGADSLARRSQRLTMQPLTPWEMAAQPGSLVDALFNGDPDVRAQFKTSDDGLLSAMLTGGFPGYVYPATVHRRRQVLERIRSDTIGLLGDGIVPDLRYDATATRTALDALLRMPGGIFNASRLAQLLDIDRRTVDRYMSVFQRLFLLHWLPNLATAAPRQSHTRAKVHPVDTSFAVESLTRSGVDLATSREHFGAVFESYVINQILASAEWARADVQSYFWRQASSSSPEVDLVIIDERGRILGVEVKSTSVVGTKDLSGLRALQESRGLHRGYVVYTGETIRQLDQDIWALPVGALAQADAFGAHWQNEDLNPESEAMLTVQTPPDQSIPAGGFDAKVFLSYVHDDDTRLSGRIVQFAHDVVDTYDFLYGHKLQLFVDREDIRWGENWRLRLADEVAATSFLMAAVTPRYLTSEPCRRELLDFVAAAETAQERKLLLSVLWVDVEQSDVVASEDPVRKAVLRDQYLDAREVRRMPPGSIEYDDLVHSAAQRLRQTIEHRSSTTTAGVVALSPSVDAPDAMTVIGKLQSRQPDLEEAVDGFKRAFDRLGAALAGTTMPQSMDTYAAAAQLKRLGDELAEPVREVDEATADLGRIWSLYDADLSSLVRFVRDVPDAGLRVMVIEDLDGLVRTMQLPGVDELQQQLAALSGFSRHLRPMSNAVSGALRLVQSIRDSARAWRGQL